MTRHLTDCETGSVGALLYHFSEDPTIRRFAPHVPATNPSQAPAVWAIDARHAPLYWFPRDCPRVAVWPRPSDDVKRFSTTWATSALRVHAIESGWLMRMRSAALYEYVVDAGPFEPWSEASGQWITTENVPPLEVRPVGDLLDAHVRAGIELRMVPSLWPIRDLAASDHWDFSIVRMANAQPRQTSNDAGADFEAP
jgi:hypothetical protein